jgi:hypothetical protein
MSVIVPSTEMKRLIQSANAAMLRAAQRAREVAARTGTRLVVEKDGKLQRLAVDGDGKVLSAKISHTKKSGK